MHYSFVPLAYQLNDPDLISLAERYIMYIISHRSEDGWLGEDDIKDGNCYWSKYHVLFVLRMYYEATGNETVFPVMFKFLHCAYQRMFTTPLGSTWFVCLSFSLNLSHSPIFLSKGLVQGGKI